MSIPWVVLKLQKSCESFSLKSFLLKNILLMQVSKLIIIIMVSLSHAGEDLQVN